MINPYQPTDIASDESPSAVRGEASLIRGEASLIWFAATVAGSLFGWFCYYKLDSVYQIGAIQVVFETLRDTGPLVIPAVVIYAVARHVYRMQFDYSSTVTSLVFAGVIAFGYLALLHYWDWYNWFDRQLIWWAGALVGLPLGFGLSALERIVARPRRNDTGQLEIADTGSVRRRANHASIFWFSGAVYVCIAACVWIMERETSNLSLLAEVSSVLCLMFTATYGVLSACVVRRHPATTVSRVAGAAVYVGMFWALTFILRGPPQNMLFLVVVLIAPAVFAVPTDRIVVRYSSSS